MSDIEITVEEEAEINITVDTNTAYVIEVPGVGAASILTTKGDLLGYSILPERIPIGTADQVLTVDLAEANGIKWATLPTPETNTIFQGNSSITVTDVTTGEMSFKTDGNEIITIETLHQPITISHAQTFLDAQAPLMKISTTGTSTTNKGAVLWLNTTRTTSTVDIDLFKVYGPGGDYIAIDNGGGVSVNSGQRITEFSIDGTMAGNSDLALPTEKAVKTYVASTLPLTTKGDIYTYSTAKTRLPVGTNGQVLSALSTETTGLKWVNADPMTTRGDIIIRNSANATARLGIGTSGQVLTSNGTDIAWGAGGGGSGDKIEEGNSSVEVVDAGTGYVSTTVDDTEIIRNSIAKRIDILGVGSTYPNGIWFGGEHVFYQDVTDTTRSTVVGFTSGGWDNYANFNSYQSLCFGQAAGQHLTTGGDNCLMGVMSGAWISTGARNTYIGTRAGFYENTNDSVGIGQYSGYFLDGDRNICIGNEAGYGVNGTTNADYNILIGYQCGKAIVNSVSNILIGYQCGTSLTSFDNKLYIENSSDTTNPLIYGEFGASSANKLCIGTATPRTTGVGLTVYGEVAPATDDTYDLGNASYRWDDVYATNATIQTSDERHKTAISGSDLGLDFICELRPVSYKWKDKTIETIKATYTEEEVEVEWFLDVSEGIEKLNSLIDRDESYEIVGDKYRVYKTTTNTVETKETVEESKTFNRPHYGMIAQEVLTTLSGVGKTSADFAGIIYDTEADIYGLRYGEFIAPMIKAIQELKDENDLLKTQMASILSRLDALEGK